MRRQVHVKCQFVFLRTLRTLSNSQLLRVKAQKKVQIIVFCTINNYSETFDTENEKTSRF